MDENQTEMAVSPAGMDYLGGYNTDWQYAMRRDMQEIVPRVFLGPYAAAMKSRLGALQSVGITHIVCIRQQIEANFIRPNFPNQFKYLVLTIADSEIENIIQHFRETKRFIDECLSHGGKVLVHGNGGTCRSPAVVTAYIMAQYSLTCSQALSVVRNARFCICVNESFLQQLMEYEHIYKAEHHFQPQAFSNASGSVKRKREVDTEDEPTSFMAITQPHQSTRQ